MTMHLPLVSHDVHTTAAMVAFVLTAKRNHPDLPIPEHEPVGRVFRHCVKHLGLGDATVLASAYAEEIGRCFGPAVADRILNDLETMITHAVVGAKERQSDR